MKKLMLVVLGIMVGLNLFVGMALAGTELIELEEGVYEFGSNCISADGRYLLYYGPDTDDGNPLNLVDRATGETNVIGDDWGREAKITPDGRYIIYQNFNGVTTGVVLYDRVNDEIAARADFSGSEGTLQNKFVSNDGKFIVYQTKQWAHLYDVIQGTDTRLFEGPGPYRTQPLTFSGNGGYVFWSNANNYIYRYDVSTGIKTPLKTGNGKDLIGYVVGSSGDGQKVVFTSNATDLVPGDTNGIADIFVYDIQADLLKRVNVSDEGEQANGENGAISMSDNGRFVVFSSLADNLVPDGSSGVFLYDLKENKIKRINEYNQIWGILISADGTYVGYVLHELNGPYGIAIWTEDSTEPQDTTAPVTICSITGTLGSDGTTSSDITYTLTADDGSEGSGVDKIEYSYDNSTWQQYTQPIVIAKGSGTNELWVRSTDHAGNVEIARKISISIQ